MKIGANTIASLKIGSTDISEVRLGSVLVWQASTLLLDLYPSTQGQYYMHKVSSSYNGACIRVRRSSDNTEQDIGFSGVDLDTSSLISFVGSSDGYVTTWYSQSGYFNLTQTSQVSQPRIVLSGVLETLNGKPCLKFDGSNDFMTAGTSANNPSSGNLFLTAIGELLYDNTALVSKTIASGQPNRYSMLRETTVEMLFVNNANTTRVPLFGNDVVARQYAFLHFWDGTIGGNTEFKVMKNNVILQSYLDTVGMSPSSFRFLLGAYNDGTDTGQILYLNGKIQQVAVWNSNQSSNYSDINTTINTYYAAY